MDIVRLEKAAQHYTEPVSKGRNRIEQRETKVYTDLSMLSNNEWKTLLACLIVVHRRREVFDTKTKAWKQQRETAFYVSDRVFSAKKAGELIRQHWHIENCDHYVRDVALQEDHSRIKLKPMNMAVLRSFVLNVMRFNKDQNIKNTLYENSLEFNDLYRYQQLI